MSFSAVKQYQNKSGNGVDLLAQIKEVDPPPPPSAGDFVAFEVKSTLGVADNPPGLSRAQRTPSVFVESRLKRARGGKGSYPALSSSDVQFLESALDALVDQTLLFRKVDIRMDHSGALAPRSGKPAMEMKAW